MKHNSVFTGFRSSDFEYFEKNDVKDHIKLKGKLKSFSSLIYENLDESIKLIYNGIYFSSYKNNKSSAWFIISRKKEARSIFKNCKFRVEIDKDSLSFTSIIQDGSHWDNKPIGILYDKIVNDPNDFFELLKAFDKGYILNIYKRIPAVGHMIVPGNEKLLPAYSTDLEDIKEENIKEFLLFLEDTKLPLVSLETMLFKSNKKIQDPEQLVDFAVENMRKQHAFFKYLEDCPRQLKD